jgi:dTDP-4-dehydrorhamnose 3,5-epimerase
MEVRHTPLNGLFVIIPNVLNDNRGYFYESYSEKKYREVLGDIRFVQDNVSNSMKNTIRGLHYQIGDSAQGKLCEVLFGKVLDIAVDIRLQSPTFGQFYCCELSDENHCQFWIPPGFAHGFSVLSERAIFHYKCTSLYSKEHERAIRFNDPDIHIDWKVTSPIVSPKDLSAPLLKDISKDSLF